MSASCNGAPKICIPCLKSYFNEVYSCPQCGSDLTDLWEYLESLECVSALMVNEFWEVEG